MIIRPATPGDYAAIRPLVQAAFATADHASGTEADIVEGVRAEGAVLAELVAEDAGEIVGHALFSRMTCDPKERFFAALGPIAAAPERQKAGIGSALLRAGVEICRAAGAEAVVLLGHVSYYPRFGFSSEAARVIASPFAGLDAFMALALTPGALEAPVKADYPAAFG
ncbi:GNAT family N-acetyltransferase [Caulobacter sp. KR2-114]|uniref:GNAT family N-acetyltransferase n=1 Tax=Caulobacter sp. KR2-114 TaxID=3400912 RepID=UPI003C0AEA12